MTLFSYRLLLFILEFVKEFFKKWSKNHQSTSLVHYIPIEINISLSIEAERAKRKARHIHESENFIEVFVTNSIISWVQQLSIRCCPCG